MKAWRRIGPTRAISPNVRGVVSIAMPWPDAGASTTTRSYVRPLRVPAAGWASSHTLAIVISSFAPGAAATKYWNADERASTFSPRAADLLREPLLERPLRVDRDRPQVLGELHLGLRDHALAPERARHAVLLGDLADDRPPARRGGRQTERRGDRRLADAALSGDVQEPPVAQQCFHRVAEG